MNQFITQYPCAYSNSPDTLRRTFQCGLGQTEKPGWYSLMSTQTLVDSGEHYVYNEHVAFYKMAQNIRNSITGTADASVVYELNIPLQISKPMAFSGHYSDYNYKPFFLAYYLASHGVRTSFFRMLEINSRSLTRSKYDRIFPATYDIRKGEYVAALENHELKSEVVWNGNSNKKPPFFLTTTHSEEMALDALAKARGWKIHRLAIPPI